MSNKKISPPKKFKRKKEKGIIQDTKGLGRKVTRDGQLKRTHGTVLTVNIQLLTWNLMQDIKVGAEHRGCPERREPVMVLEQ